MKTIWKYKFDIQDDFVIEMPKNANILTVQIQHDSPCIWALVETENSIEDRHFKLFGTGHQMYYIDIKYVGTFQMRTGNLIFHLFEKL
jgi:hypothetical protein